MDIKKNVPKAKLILFDWDGVLCDSLPVFYQLYKTKVGNVSLNAFKKIASRRIYGEKLLPGKLLDYRKELVTAELFPGIDTTIRTLSITGIKLAIISTNKSDIIKPILERTGSLKYIDGIYGSDFFIKKPDKMLLEIIEKDFSISRSAMLYVGDDLTDILFVKAGALRSLFVTYGYTSKKDLGARLKENGTLKIPFISKPQELLAAITKRI